jgi:hypothetical protein
MVSNCLLLATIYLPFSIVRFLKHSDVLCTT